ncbi:uncharacterized protein SETTUDRAFT_91900 [Exserohilum turcica Et28A]|uniref:HSF-type DNA-binding domain-containing protein n=1 Tax=Exserohilum turcicum (strain 28A) TaxID=671987 RepID=R0IHW6_EXST2|nr:uncharacterized protein SETTUDRAFT_91900 [Exserohilum turcica Et28A]EOA84780.1 hypothetical protein SETTUDRAFT_91900 [Exserohilum turcica Et28A]
MLENPSDESVVRWGNDGDSFVVLENEKFTKHILPKHFKHSNFASFVRQLNKYDFHKVRHNNEENGQSPYGPGVCSCPRSLQPLQPLLAEWTRSGPSGVRGRETWAPLVASELNGPKAG